MGYIYKNCTGVAPDNPCTEIGSFHHHADILCCEFPVACVVLTYVVKYHLPFITIIVRFLRMLASSSVSSANAGCVWLHYGLPCSSGRVLLLVIPFICGVVRY